MAQGRCGIVAGLDRAARARSPRAGFVLVAVLGVTALAGALVGSLLLLSRAGVGEAVLKRDAVVAEAMIGAGIEAAAYQLFALRVPAPSLDGQEIRFDAGRVRIAAVAEAGLVDINGSDAALLAAVYRASGGRALAPDTFAQLVIDWRDGDDEDHAGGSERARYAAAGLAYPPANRPFERLEDLRLLPGLPAAEVAAMRDLLTIYNPSGRIDPMVAPRPVLALLPGVGAPTVARLLELRRRPLPGVREQMIGLLGDSARFAGAGQRAGVRVGIMAEPATGRGRRVTAVLIPGVAGGALYHVAEWAEAP